MENIYEVVGPDGLDSLRMSSRPQPLASSTVAPGKGKFGEDIGRTQYQIKSHHKSRNNPSSSKRLTSVAISSSDDGDSDDDLDLFSAENSSPPHSSGLHPHKKRLKSKSNAKGKSQNAEAKAKEGAVWNGEVHDYHPDFKPKATAFPKFKKIKPVSDAAEDEPSSTHASGSKDASSSTSRPRPRAAYKSAAGKASSANTSDASNQRLTATSSNPQANASAHAPSSLRHLRSDTSPSTPRPSNPKPPRETLPLHDRNSNHVNEEPSRPRPRPKARYAGALKEREAFPMPSPSSTSKATSPPASRTTMRKKLSEFPSLSPVRDKAVKGKGKAKTKDQHDSFPALSPLSSQKTIEKTSSFAAPFPLSSPITRKGKAKQLKDMMDLSFDHDGDTDVDEDEDELAMRADDAVETHGGPRPFPMSTQQLKSIGSGSNLDIEASSTKKRLSSERSGCEWEPGSKKRRGDDDVEPAVDLDGDTYQIDDDSIFIDPSVDPSTLCPYCDEPLPSAPTPHLRALLVSTRRKSYRDTRPSNPLGLKAPLSTFVAVCQRHRFETHQLPRAQAKGWPVEIEWERLRERVEGMKAWLEALVQDGGEDEDWDERDNGESKNRGPRTRSVFWREVMKEVKKKGSRAVVGVRGQFASFEKTQPGYYGELGSVIIHQTLYNLFPPSSFNPMLIVPLTPTEFIQRILVPEVAVALIMDDMDIGKIQAVETLRESVQYGVAMFPDAGNADGEEMGMGAGDEIVKERARLRRKELEEEERIEEEMLEKEKVGMEDGGGKKRNAKGKRRNVEAEDLSEASDVGRPGKSRRRGRKYPADSEVSDTSSRSTTGRGKSSAAAPTEKSVRPRPRARRKADVDLTRSEDETENSDARTDVDTESEGYKRGLKGKAKARDAVDQATPHAKFMKSTVPRVLDNDATPRPVNATGGSKTTKIPPLLVARARRAASKPRDDEWSSSLRSPVSEDLSDTSIETTYRMRGKKGSYSWLLSSDSQIE